MRVGDTVFMLAGEFFRGRHLSPDTLGGSSVGLMLPFPDSEATYAACDRDGRRTRAATDRGSVRCARKAPFAIRFGHRCFVETAIEPDDGPVEKTCSGPSVRRTSVT